MRIRKFSLQGFRNIGHVTLEDVANVNELVGLNGQGKTNLLEAMYFWLTGTSFRGADVREMTAENGTGFELSGLVEADTGLINKVSMQVSMQSGLPVKAFFIDDQKAPITQATLRYPVVVFSPEEVDMIRTTPQARRKLVDLAGVLVSGRYKELLVEYVRIWRNRNQLLLAVKQRRADEGELDVWDEQMARVGVEVVKLRKQVVEELEIRAQGGYKLFAPTGGGMGLKYKPNLNAATEAEYRQELRLARQLDIIKSHTTRGIHRDDLVILEAGQPATERASRGEFRSVVLAIKLAYGQLAYETLSEKPVYLLDDVMAELDDERRAALLKNLQGFQVVITGHEKLGLERSWEISAGEVRVPVG